MDLALSPDDWLALRTSLIVAGRAVVVGLPLAVGAALLLSRGRFVGRSALDALVHAPLVLSPVVVGFLLLLVFGVRGPVGGLLFKAFGLRLAFTSSGASLAAGVGAFPLMVRSVRQAFDAADPRLEAAARSLGARPLDRFLSITLPLAWPGVVSALVIGFCACLGEFGAVITFAASIPGETQTLPLAIYADLQAPGGEGAALKLAAVSFVIAVGGLLIAQAFSRGPSLERPVSLLQVAITARRGAFQLDASFQASEGLTVLFGPSGAGKSSVLAAIAGVLRPDSGAIRLGEATLFDEAAGIDFPPERRGVGWVFQDARLFPHLSVEGNLRYGLKRARGRTGPIAFDDVVEALGVGRLLGRRPQGLSGGEAQRVALGRALLSQPRLLLMDEPLAALDSARKDEILTFIETVRDGFGTPILYVTHALAETARLADRLVVLDGGRVIAEGPLAEVMGRPDLPLLSSRPDAAAVIEGVVVDHDAERGLTRVKAGTAIWICPALSRSVGAPVRLRVMARDVLLAIEPPRGLSARNVLPGQVESLTVRPDGVVLARLKVGGQGLLSAITPDAVETLALRPGLPIWAVVKSLAIEGPGRRAGGATFDP